MCVQPASSVMTSYFPPSAHTASAAAAAKTPSPSHFAATVWAYKSDILLIVVVIERLEVKGKS